MLVSIFYNIFIYLYSLQFIIIARLSSASLPKVQVRAGSISSFQHGTVRNVTKFVRHPNYDSNNMDNDVALVKVDESFVWKMYVIQPLPINQFFNPPPGEEVIVTGWGHMEDGGSRPIELRYVMLPTISLKECKRYYRFFKQTPTENMFCTYAPGKDACQGDSGGPAVHDSELVGIVSWGRGCAKEGSPGVFTNLSSSAVYNFVNRQMEIL